MLKAIILIGGPMKGTRFRPLSLELPKPLFPVAGFPIIYHHIEACSKLPEMREIILIGFYQPNDALNKFISQSQQEFQVQIRYLQEYNALGTAGGLYHFRDQILTGNPKIFFVMNADVCGDFPLQEMLDFHQQLPTSAICTVLAAEATRQQSLTYGCIVENKDTHEILHYVEKPETFVSTTINCGIYLFTPQIFQPLEIAFKKNLEENYNFDYQVPSKEVIRLEQDVLLPMASSGTLYVFQSSRFWSQIKSAGAAIYANRHYLAIYRRTHRERLAVNGEGKPKITGDVFIHSTAQVHPTAVLGPNVTIGRNVTVGEGVRVRESIILEGATLQEIVEYRFHLQKMLQYLMFSKHFSLKISRKKWLSTLICIAAILLAQPELSEHSRIKQWRETQDHCCILHSIIGWHSTVGYWTRVEGTPNDPNPNKPFAKLEIPSMFSEDGRLNPSITVIGSSVQVPPEVIVLNSIVLPHKDLSGCYKNQIIL